MRSYIDNEKLETISDCLNLLEKIKEAIEEIKFQLEYAPCGNDAWRNAARKALAVFQKQRRTVEHRLAVLRQEEKERNIRRHERVNDFLVRELKERVPESVFFECEAIARSKALETD
ncbi:hypothetical protein B6R37_003196 [Escherichia coli]|nr:hypothetical protein [Escherichia coli]EGD0669539.1 hypothetical protein [Escherichia coli]